MQQSWRPTTLLKGDSNLDIKIYQYHMTLQPPMEKCPMGFYEGVVFTAQIWHQELMSLEIKRFVKFTWIGGNEVSFSWSGVPKRILWMRFTCCPNLMFLAFHFATFIFQTGHFANFEQFKIDGHFSDFDPRHLYLLILSRSHLFYQLWARCLTTKNIPNPSRTTHRIWLKLFSMTESIKIKNWLGSPLNKWTSKAQPFISFSNMFFWFVRQNKICMMRIMTQKVIT